MFLRHKSLPFEENSSKLKIQEFISTALQRSSSYDDVTETPEVTALDFLFGEEAVSQNWKTQLESYVAEPQIGHNLDPLTWWKNHKEKYPDLLKLAHQYLGIPATSASSERTFSTAGNIVSPKRASLLPENINLLTFLYNNRTIWRKLTPRSSRWERSIKYHPARVLRNWRKKNSQHGCIFMRIWLQWFWLKFDYNGLQFLCKFPTWGKNIYILFFLLPITYKVSIWKWHFVILKREVQEICGFWIWNLHKSRPLSRYQKEYLLYLDLEAH